MWFGPGPLEDKGMPRARKIGSPLALKLESDLPGLWPHDPNPSPAPSWLPRRRRWRPKMASLLPETLFEAGGQGPAPSKDYYQLQITRSQVSLRWWRISLRNDYRLNKPGVTKEGYEDFLDDVNLHVQIALVFGSKVLQYVINLCKGKYDFLERLSDPLLLRIISYLDLEDIARLSQTSHRFQKLCTSDKLWEQIVALTCDTVTQDMKSLAKDIGWRQLYFTNKLQLQRQIRKRRQKHDGDDKQEMAVEI
uniref:F-box protein 36 n=1 Tax=Sarcophilus harrisii TaxID=9305 RepID=A0A7N4PJM0_SARHA